jgi:hypothetical protein
MHFFFSKVGRTQNRGHLEHCSLAKRAYIRTLLQRLVIHRDRAVNEIVVLR